MEEETPGWVGCPCICHAVQNVKHTSACCGSIQPKKSPFWSRTASGKKIEIVELPDE